MNTQHFLALRTALALFSSAILLFAAGSDDDRIVSAAKHSYVYRTYLKDDHIKIQSKDGCVTLKGDVGSLSHKEMAADTVENLPGVKSVDNQLQVKATSEDEKSDDWIAFKTKSALLYHRSVSGT